MDDPNKLIDDMGGTGALADLCGLSASAISQWRKNGIPRPWLKFLREIRPDIFGPPPPEAEERAA